MDGRALLAWNLRRLRTVRDISQERLAADTGVDRAYISQLERREGNATVDLLDRLAEVLDVEVREFFERPADDASAPQPLRSGRRPSAR